MCETHRGLAFNRDEINVPKRRPKSSTLSLFPHLQSEIKAITDEIVTATQEEATATQKPVEKPIPAATPVQRRSPEQHSELFAALAVTRAQEGSFNGRKKKAQRLEWQRSATIDIARACGMNMRSFLIKDQKERVRTFSRIARVVSAKIGAEAAEKQLPEFLKNPS